MHSVKTIRALSRGLAVIRALETRDALTLHQLSEQTGLTKPTLLRILRTLGEEGYVRRGIADQQFRLTVRTSGVTARGARGLLAETAAPALDRLCHEVLWPSDLAVYRDGGMRIQETTRRLSPFMMNRDVLSHHIHVLQSGMGRAYLAYCADAEREQIIRTLAASRDPLDREARDRRAVAAAISEVRETGYAARAPGYFITHVTEARVSAIAVPVMHRGAAIGAINLIWVSRAAGEAEFVREHLERLQQAAREIETAYGKRAA